MISILTAEFEAAVPGTMISFADIASFAEEDVKAGITELLSRVAWPSEWADEARRFTTAQLLAWPTVGESSMKLFSEQMLVFIECIDAVQLAVQAGTSYPEETCLFVDVERTHSAVLAAVFCLHAASELWDANEATS